MGSAPRESEAARDAERPRNLRPVPGGSLRSGPPELDKLIHERLRLAIVSALAGNE